MPSTFFGLNIAASGMSTYYAGLNTTGHNIANVKTKGYSKQIVEQRAKEAISLKTSYGMIGAGVEAYDIVSSRDVYYDYKYRKSNANYGRYDTLSHYMKNVAESLYEIDETSGGVNNSLNLFLAGISGMTENVPDNTIRTQVIGYGDSMMGFIQEVADGLLQSQKELNEEIDTAVDKINAYAKQIASLTQQINTLEVYGSRANDLRDQRAVAVDELSALVDVEVIEQAPADGQGLNQFLVFIGDGVLVDSNKYNQIEIVTKTTKDNQNDAEGLYELRWSYGQEFNIRNANLGGSLQALFELRDGNNGENFRATLTEFEEKNDKYGNKSTITLVTDSSSSFNASNLSQLNIPESDGLINIANYEYQYESFEVTVGADGTYTYTFVLSDELTKGKADHLQVALDNGKTSSVIGDEVDFRGIPYYMAQLNEFVRVFSANFNQIQNGGYDLYNNPGSDVFVAVDVATGEEFDMTEFLYNKKEDYYYLNGCKVLNANAQADFANKGYTLEAVPNETGYFMLKDAEGKEVEKVYVPQDDKKVFTFTSYTTSGQPTSYYNMTALHATVSNDVLGDGNKLACSSEPNSGVSNGENLKKLAAIREDDSMFKQGAPSSFLAVLVATVGVDGEKVDDCASNAKNIVQAVDNRRLSKSGVDEDEEGQNLIQYQNLLNYQYRVISVMNEVLDKLINETGV
ncbi:MAG: flagellar hook-associated protein FlgK [Lachnospiraceae bacterium]|nr:flagellar hook-associated protein FlgK [Lachnospiraceae bacterium]